MTSVVGVTGFLKSLPPKQKVAIVLLADLVLLVAVLLLSYMLRLSAFELPPFDRSMAYAMAPFLSLACAYGAGVYQSAARSYSSRTEHAVIFSQGLAILLWSLLLVVFGTAGFARSVIFIYGILAIGGMIVLRKIAAAVFSDGSPVPRKKQRIPTLIFGAGREGAALLEGLRRQGGRIPLAFIDTDYTLVDRRVSGLKVYSPEDLDKVVARYEPQEIIVAKSGMIRAHRQTLVDRLIDLGLQVKIAPGIDEITDGKVGVGDIRPVRVEDLLGRDSVPPERALMEKAIMGMVVMVTGAGGSIGSELVRQCAQYQPKVLVLVDNSEFALFEIHREMEQALSRKADAPTLVPILADVKDKQKIAAIISGHKVEIIFHAAAYKHVRMVQENVRAGVANNVQGTKACAEAALEHGVKRFILVSTDKAVRPTSAMGASKRVAELIVQALAAEKSHKTVFSMVRFGNVLGSTGSVVPLFREQIARGGPVQVTHPDITRYFMLIPEAAQLVIQAGAMAEGGEVYVLDMGEPIKIMQLAETMIELAGLTIKSPKNPDGDIEIAISGLKDGEKLYEELQIGNDVSPTGHDRIMKSREIMLPLGKLEAELKKLLAAPTDQRSIAVLMKLASDKL